MSRTKILTPAGIRGVEVGDREEAAVIDGHWQAIDRFLATGDDSWLAHFRGISIAGQFLAADPAVVEFWARRGIGSAP